MPNYFNSYSYIASYNEMYCPRIRIYLLFTIQSSYGSMYIEIQSISNNLSNNLTNNKKPTFYIDNNFLAFSISIVERFVVRNALLDNAPEAELGADPNPAEAIDDVVDASSDEC